MFYDTHCHLDFAAYDQDRRRVVERAQARGVLEFLVPGVAPSSWAAQAEALRAHPQANLAFGVHPFWAHEVEPGTIGQVIDDLERRLDAERVVAVGECGLDALWVERRGGSLDHQVLLLEAQLDLARRRQLPIVIHCVRAHGRLLETLKAAGQTSAGGVLHAYSGSAELVDRYCELGYYFGFGGAVTRPNAKRAREALRRVPAERLLLETDAPDQAPAWVSGRNEPAELSAIAAKLAELLEIPLAELARQTTENAERLLRR